MPTGVAASAVALELGCSLLTDAILALLFMPPAAEIPLLGPLSAALRMGLLALLLGLATALPLLLRALSHTRLAARLHWNAHVERLLPLWGALVTNCDLDTRRAKGVSRWWPGAGSAPSSQAPEGAAYLEVSAGLGTSPMAPVRFACRPEASLLTLVPRDA